MNRNLHEGSRLLRATYRSARFVIAYQLAGICVVLAVALPSTQALLRVPLTVAVACLGAVLLVNLLSTLAFHRFGEDARYKVVATLEIVTYQVAVMKLIESSGSSASFFWILWIAQAAANPGITEHPRALLTVCMVPPLVLALVFLSRGDIANAVGCVLVTAVGFLLFSAGFRTHMQLAEALSSREAALAELAELRVKEERLRIARDLHDGVAADLVAVAARAQWAHGRVGAGAAEDELNAIAGRAREALDDLRTIVWSMRAPDRSALELASYLEARCREVLPKEMGFEANIVVTDRAPVIPGGHALSIVRAAQECCRNVVRHAMATRLRLGVEVDELFKLYVEDNGRGLPIDVEQRLDGGLKNLRQRTERGGDFRVVRLVQGTRIELDFALGSAATST